VLVFEQTLRVNLIVVQDAEFLYLTIKKIKAQNICVVFTKIDAEDADKNSCLDFYNELNIQVGDKLPKI
jgi:predicted RNA-binding protein with PIN domain